MASIAGASGTSASPTFPFSRAAAMRRAKCSCVVTEMARAAGYAGPLMVKFISLTSVGPKSNLMLASRLQAKKATADSRHQQLQISFEVEIMDGIKKFL